MKKIRTLSIDIETYSDMDLQKCGVYKYAQSPAFEILLFGVSVNGGEVMVYDLAQGEEIPMEIIQALTDDMVTIAIPQITANIHNSETTHYNPKYKLFPEHF